MSATRPCRDCGRPTAAWYCGSCVKTRTFGAYNYARTHVHIWDDGHRTIELGQVCRGEEEAS